MIVKFMGGSYVVADVDFEVTHIVMDRDGTVYATDSEPEYSYSQGTWQGQGIAFVELHLLDPSPDYFGILHHAEAIKATL